MIKHSVIINCYNQKNFIKEALDSLLNEETKPFEIIIGDDCSYDGTQAVLQAYQKKYPEIIRLFLHKNNLGIFGNLNEICKHAKGDMVHLLAGDDWFKPGFLNAVNREINTLALDPKISSFIILPTVVMYYQDGSEVRLSNSQKDLSGFSPTGLALRGILKWRLTCISRALYDKWPNFEHDATILGPWTDRVHYVLLSQHIEALYPLKDDGAVYRVGVGVASKTSTQQLNESYLYALERLKEHYLQKKLLLPLKDLIYLDFLIACHSAKIKPNIKKYIKYYSAAIKVCFISTKDLRHVLKEIYRDIRDLCS